MPVAARDIRARVKAKRFEIIALAPCLAQPKRPGYAETKLELRQGESGMGEGSRAGKSAQPA